MKFIRVNLWDNAGYMDKGMSGEVEVEVAGLNFRIPLSEEAKARIFNVAMQQASEGVIALKKEINRA